jgi:hypothetical protein
MTAAREPEVERLRAGFAEATASAPEQVVEASLRLAGRPVRASVVGRRLADQVLAPFVHLRDPAARLEPPELQIELWDSEASGVPLPGALPERGISGSGRVMIAADAAALTAIDRPAARIVGWRRSHETLPVEERWRPLPGILPFWYLDRGVNIVHAAMVGRGGDGVLLVGPSGAGKSTTALACAAAGMELIGDDQVGISEQEGSFRAHMLFATARLWPEVVAGNPWLACEGTCEPLVDGKLLVIPGERAHTRTEGNVLGMLVLRTGASRSGLRSAGPGEALRASAPYSLVGVVGGGRWGLARIGALVRRLPLRALEVKGGPAEAATLVEEAFEELRG